MKQSKREEEDSTLPWQHPKRSAEDPHAKQLVKKLMESPTYIMAEEDTEFLKSSVARGLRLELDYLKAETKMDEYGIEHVIVVFGSARIVEHKTAMQKLKAIQKKLADDPQSKELLREMYTAERMVEKSIYYEDARIFGSYVGKCGKGSSDNRIILMTGGGPGIMEAANRGAYDVGAKSIGLNIKLPHEQFPNPYITPDLCFQFRYFAIRKLHFINRARALVVYPGGYGTLDELFEILTLVQTRKTDPIPIVLVGKSYWHKAVDFNFLVEEGVIVENDRQSFIYAENAAEAWEYILAWHKKRKHPLLHEGEKSGKSDGNGQRESEDTFNC
jgi:uncharacterized protein (TIGR00730 family)